MTNRLHVVYRRPWVATVWVGAILLVVALVAGFTLPQVPRPARAHATSSVLPAHPGISRLLAASAGAPGDLVAESPVAAVAGSLVQGVALLDGRPAGSRIAALERLGLEVRPMRNLPLAFVAGTPAQLLRAVVSGAAADVYPNERLRYFSAESDAALGADRVRDLGLTGKGIGVAIVDSGIDATHPDLADHVAHNFKVINGDYFGEPVNKLIPPVVIPWGPPYDNTDLTTGHGTHVAGIVAADGHTSPDQVGVAPDATIIGYSCGDVVFLFTQLAAFDSILTHRQEWNIRVVNNSWGSSFGMFDPANPINVATRAMHDAGIAVVFAAGNAGEEMTLSPYSSAPWVISVGAATLDKERLPFSSSGLEFDDSTAAEIPPDDHVRFEGDSLGLYHPSVSAPGKSIVSSGTPTAIGITAPTLPGGTTALSGTSMAAPHVTGVAALLFEARPSLTPDEVKQVLQVTATPMKGDDTALWQAGYGFTDAKGAVDLVRRPDFGPALLSKLQSEADARVKAQRPYRVLASDFWRFTAPVVSAGTDQHTFWVDVPDDTVAFRMSVSYPTLPLLGLNPLNYALTLADANGQIVARSVSSSENGLSGAFVSLVPSITGQSAPSPHDLFAFGAKWRLNVRGMLSAADPDLPTPGVIGNSVTVVLASLGAKEGGVPPAETPQGPPPKELAGIPLPALPPIPGLPLSEPQLPAVPLPALPLGCPPGATPQLDLAGLLERGSLINCG